MEQTAQSAQWAAQRLVQGAESYQSTIYEAEAVLVAHGLWGAATEGFAALLTTPIGSLPELYGVYSACQAMQEAQRQNDEWQAAMNQAKQAYDRCRQQNSVA
jgi:hypothetical protein